MTDKKPNQDGQHAAGDVTAGYAAFGLALASRPDARLVAGHSSRIPAWWRRGASARDCCVVRFARGDAGGGAAGEGAIAASLSLEDEKVIAACAEAGGVVEAVNFNAPGQVVIAGEKGAVERAIAACKARGARRAMPLPVSAPFHSSLMRPAGARLAPFLEKLSIGVPQVPLINNVEVKIESDPSLIGTRSCARPTRRCAGRYDPPHGGAGSNDTSWNAARARRSAA